MPAPQALRFRALSSRLRTKLIVLLTLGFVAGAAQLSFFLGANLASRALVAAGTAGLGLLLGGLWLAAALARRVSRSLRELERGARRISEGRLDTRVAVSAGDELGAVAAAFNDMASRLRATTISKAGLEDLVRARTAELTASADELQKNLRELQDTQAQLAASSRLAAVGALAAGVAHEINNPLAFVVANTGFARDLLVELEGRLRDGAAPDAAEIREILQALEEARVGAGRVREIVRDLQALARADEERREAVDVRRVIESSLRMASHELPNGVRVVRDVEDAPPVLGSEGRLAQVFLNLIVNAAQAMPGRAPGEGEIRISARADAERVTVEVRDNGAGIPAQDLERVFEPFFTTKPPGVGTGLGLAICKRIVEQMGGTIAVESREGEGTAFRVALPRFRSEPSAPPPLAPAPAPGPRGRVLVVDDEPLVASSVQRTLAGHEVVVARDGREALARLRGAAPFDVVLCDLVMPVMNGMELYAELQRSSPEVLDRVVFVTGAAFSPVVREFLERVPNARVEKPFDPEALRQLVRERVDGLRAGTGEELPATRRASD